MGKMEITYLDHSGFAVELNESLLVFDYYNFCGTDSNTRMSSGVLDDETVKKASRVYIFVSHWHYDHFNRGIFRLHQLNPNTMYILASDVLRIPEEVRAVRLSAGQKYEDAYLCVQAHPSTDIGVSFQVTAEGKTLFHAGDLNCWHWAGECPAAEERANRERFTRILEGIKQSMPSADVAFFPADKRIKKDYDDGILEFARTFHPGLLVPMHMWGRYEIPEELSEKIPGQKIFLIQKRGDKWTGVNEL